MRDTICKILTGIIAILVLNCSIEPPYPQGSKLWNGKDYVEDLSFNQIESLYEMVTESWLCIDDVVPETNDDDNDDDAKPLKDYYWLAPLTGNSVTATRYTLHTYLLYADDTNNGYEGYTAPPPDGFC